jgi:short subunit dehydrogenase-like uncharacterized protein
LITLFGATGYTGRRVARALDRAGRPFRIAGRSPEKLAALQAELAAPPAFVVAGAHRPEPLFAGLPSGPHVLLNCAGPFTDLGEPVARAAALRGSHYLDVSNELAFVYGLRQYDALARSAGAALVPAAGFEVAIADCLAARAARELGGALDSVHVIYALPGGAISYGTRLAGLRTYARSWWTYRGGRWVGRLPGGEVRAGALGGRPYRAISFPSAEVVTVPAHVAVQDVQAWLAVAPRWARLVAALMPLIDILLRTPLGALTALSFRLAPPPLETLAGPARFAVQVEARRGGRERHWTARGQDPYTLTGDIAVFVAGQLLKDDFAGRGVLAPAQALEPEAFLEWLAGRGVTLTAG